MTVIGLTTSLAYEVGPLGVNVNTLSPGPVRGPRMERNFRLEAERTGTSAADAEEAFVSRSALHRMVEEAEVAAAVIAMLHMPGLCAADIDLSQREWSLDNDSYRSSLEGAFRRRYLGSTANYTADRRLAAKRE
jgi:NAD(P)-dependent dehydrogenase (short-subunit alcohol dehydrogenase family)